MRRHLLWRLVGFRLCAVLLGGYWLLVTGHWSLALAQPIKQAREARPVGKTISLDLKGVDIIDVLKLLSQHSGLNFVAGRNVTGRVTIFAKDVEVWEAFERIVEANELAYERQDNLITVMTARDYELLYGERFQGRQGTAIVPLRFAKANQLAPVANQLKSTLGQVVVDEPSNTMILRDTPPRLEAMQQVVAQLDRPTATRVYPLNYAVAEKVQERVRELLTDGIGMVSMDPRTNKLIVTDLVEVVGRIDQLVRAFDEREGEVLIEAKIVKVELTDDLSLGIDWQQVFSGIDTKARSNFRVLGDVVGGTATGAALKFASAPKENSQVVLEALKKYGKVETLSNPRITVSNNQEARILIGTKEAFVTVTTTVPTTGSVVSSPEVQFVDVGTKLFVTPTIARDGFVHLKVKPEVSSASVETVDTGAAKNRIPIVSTTEAETSVLVKSGSTLIIGGLIDSKTEFTHKGLPGLGDLPLLGAAFRSRVQTKKKTETVLFLTPQIITASGDPITDFSAASGQAEALGAMAPAVPAVYQAIIRAHLNRRLADELRTLPLSAGSAVVSFALSREGRVIGTPEITSAQGEAFVQAARAALRAAEPFPPFPPEVQPPQVRFRLAVEYAPTAGP